MIYRKTELEKIWDLREFLGDDELLEELITNCDDYVKVILSLVKQEEEDSEEKCTGCAIEWLKETNKNLSIDFYLKARSYGTICPQIATFLEEKYELCEI